MSGILEALDMMYEVKGEGKLAAAYRRDVDKDFRKNKNIGKGTHDHGYASGMSRSDSGYGPMRNAQDYRDRTKFVDRHNQVQDYVEKKNAETRQYQINRHKAKSEGCKTECTETIDTLDGILL